MPNMASIDKTELSVRVRNEVFVAIDRMAGERNVTRSELVADWLERMTRERTRDFGPEDLMHVSALRNKHLRERGNPVRRPKVKRKGE